MGLTLPQGPNKILSEHLLTLENYIDLLHSKVWKIVLMEITLHLYVCPVFQTSSPGSFIYSKGIRHTADLRWILHLFPLIWFSAFIEVSYDTWVYISSKAAQALINALDVYLLWRIFVLPCTGFKFDLSS